MLACLLINLSGCNAEVVDIKYHFNYAIIQMVDEEVKIPIKSWKDYENSDMVQVTSTDGVVYYTHSSRIILVDE